MCGVPLQAESEGKRKVMSVRKTPAFSSQCIGEDIEHKPLVLLAFTLLFCFLCWPLITMKHFCVSL